MLIKNVTRKGEAVALSPEECIPHALEYGIKKKNTPETVYWVRRDTLKVEAFHFTPNEQGGWDASAQGNVGVGKTIAKTDEFFDPKPHSFSVRYRAAKDFLGLPDISIIEFKMEPVGNNPTDLMNFAEPEAEPASEE